MEEYLKMGPGVQRHNNAGLYPLFRDINIICYDQTKKVHMGRSCTVYREKIRAVKT